MVKKKKIAPIQTTEFGKAKDWEGSVCLGNDLLLSDQINKAPMPSEPRKMNFILIGLCTKGRIKYRMNTQEVTVHAGEMLVVSERHVIDGYQPSEDMEGLCIMMSVDFFHEIIKSVHDISSLFVVARMQPVMKLEDDEIETFKDYFQVVKQKITDNYNHFRKDLIRTLMLAMFYDVGNVIYRVKNFDESLRRSEKVFTNFLKMVEENCRKERRLAWYAQQLNITPKYLSEAVKRVSGRSAVEWVENYVTMELRVLLKNSTKTIKEIANEMNFPNQSFLGKYFKEHVGVTPSEYRKS